MKAALCLAFAIFGLPAFDDPPVPRDGWSLAANGHDLIGPGLWQRVDGVTSAATGKSF